MSDRRAKRKHKRAVQRAAQKAAAKQNVIYLSEEEHNERHAAAMRGRLEEAQALIVTTTERHAAMRVRLEEAHVLIPAPTAALLDWDEDTWRKAKEFMQAGRGMSADLVRLNDVEITLEQQSSAAEEQAIAMRERLEATQALIAKRRARLDAEKGIVPTKETPTT